MSASPDHWPKEERLNSMEDDMATFLRAVSVQETMSADCRVVVVPVNKDGNVDFQRWRAEQRVLECLSQLRQTSPSDLDSVAEAILTAAAREGGAK